MHVTVEIDLLVEIEDIEDELGILYLVLKDQNSVLEALDDAIDQSYPDGRSHAMSNFDKKCIKSHAAHIEKMQEMATKVKDMVGYLLAEAFAQSCLRSSFAALSGHRPETETSKFFRGRSCQKAG